MHVNNRLTYIAWKRRFGGPEALDAVVGDGLRLLGAQDRTDRAIHADQLTSLKQNHQTIFKILQ